MQTNANPSKIETVIANPTQIVPSQNKNAHMQTKNKLTDKILLLFGLAKLADNY